MQVTYKQRLIFTPASIIANDLDMSSGADCVVVSNYDTGFRFVTTYLSCVYTWHVPLQLCSEKRPEPRRRDALGQVVALSAQVIARGETHVVVEYRDRRNRLR